MTRTRAADAEAILRAAITAADPAPHVTAALRSAPEMQPHGSVHAIAIGKAACRMLAGAAAALADRLASRLVIVPHGVTCAGARHAAHPLPDGSSVDAARDVVRSIDRIPHAERLLVLLSGGASALVAQPVDDITVHEYADCVRLLQRAGAGIVELNTVRKHLDALKGGRLAVQAAPRRTLGLILSDVVDDPIDVIASGPLVPDPTTFADAIGVLERRGVWTHCAESIRRALGRGAADSQRETPKHPRDFGHARTTLVGGNALARAGAADAARALGYHTIASDVPIVGEARVAGAQLAEHARALQQHLAAADAPLCFVCGGETTVTVAGSGRGGRNQELVLAAAIALDDAHGITIGSAGTDGIDGDCDAAGAIADVVLLAQARANGLEPHAFLLNNDSYGFFRRAGGLLTTGPTGTNVMDVQLVLIEPAR